MVNQLHPKNKDIFFFFLFELAQELLPALALLY